jgi:hypothetical protein
MKEYAKAVTGAILAALTALQVALNPLADGKTTVTASEWVGVGIAAVVVFGGVFAVPNSPPSP